METNTNIKYLRCVNNLQKRVVSSLVMVILFGSAVYVHHIGLLLTFGLMVFLTVTEFLSMVKPKTSKVLPIVMGLAVFFGLYFSTYHYDLDYFLGFLIVLCFYHLYILLELLILKSERALLSYIPGVLYLSLAASSIHYFQYDASYQKDLFILLALVWASDTGGYFVGRYYGKTPLAPSISPSKTREGFAGGILLGFLFSSVLILCHVIDWRLYIVAFIVHLLVVLGDLIESKLKRLTQVKDSSHLIPGHGGFLDRCDGLLFALPFAILIYHSLFKM